MPFMEYGEQPNWKIITHPISYKIKKFSWKPFFYKQDPSFEIVSSKAKMSPWSEVNKPMKFSSNGFRNLMKRSAMTENEETSSIVFSPWNRM